MELVYVASLCVALAYFLIMEWEKAVKLKRPDVNLRWLMIFFLAMVLVAIWGLISR